MTLPLYQPTAPTLTPTGLPAALVEALYVHIPFCFHKCHYCDFYSITRQSVERMDQFVDRLLREADGWTTAAGPTLRPRTIFFGGGTPSLLPFEPMRRLLRGLRDRFDLSQLVEWTIECNPATVSADYSHMLREHGVNRLSFGAQSFHPDELKVLERHHDPEDVPRSLDIARAAGFERLNLDLIYAIPGQTLDRWADNLERAIALGTSHLSCYALTYEPNTAIAVRRRLGDVIAVADEIDLQMLHHTRRRLAEAGLAAYEISNYASPGMECLHNLAYWRGDDYLALGPSGASHVQGHRWKNRPHLREWEQAIDQGRLPVEDNEHLSPLQRAGELAMLRLRLAEGLDFADFTRRTGLVGQELFADPITRFEQAGLLERTETALRLTPAGLNVADALTAEFLFDEP